MTPEELAQRGVDRPTIRVEITDDTEFHCFRVVFINGEGHQIEIYLHATQLVHLIHQASVALSEWQHRTTSALLARLTSVFPLGRWNPRNEDSPDH